MSRVRFFFIILLLGIIGCSDYGKEENQQRNIQMRTVCSLDENLVLMDRPLSLDVAMDGSFLVSDGSNIIGYDSFGKQTFVLNKKGRGPYEYLVSEQVRAYADTIYVWDSGTARLIAYDQEGNGLWVYDYDSAICDFRPAGSSIFIYPCGRKWGNIVQELDVKTKSIIRSYGSSSMAHKAFQSASAAVPFAIYNGTPYFMSRDKLDLYKAIPDSTGVISLVKQFSSDSFKCKDIDEDLFAVNFTSGLEYILQNSYVISFSIINGESYKVLTAEGTAKPGRIRSTGKIKLDKDNLVFRLYQIDKDSQSVSTSARLFDPSLISERDGALYVLKEDRENETYQLVTLE